MNDLDALAFSALFKEAYQKCFGHVMTETLSETESKLFSAKIFDQTGLVIGPKSIKNYSFYVLNSATREENPSVATMDTLARFVCNAPYTDEVQRKNKESHYPYWFNYKNDFYQSYKKPVKKKFPYLIPILLAVIVIAIAAFLFFSGNPRQETFTDNFISLNEDSLSTRGWMIQLKDEDYWQKRNEQPGSLTLFTLKGDNWPDSANKPGIKNLLIRKIASDCFTTEVHLTGFIPEQNWQQAGILLMEDTNFIGKTLRLSVSYNDFSGGFPKSREIIIQAIASQGKDFYKPEELSHHVIFKIDSANENMIKENLAHSALRIEKNGTKFRLLYANGSMANSAFKEVISKDIDMKPKYVALFALRGFVDSSSAIPARFDFFSYNPEKCDE
jgi:hypothetical protein